MLEAGRGGNTLGRRDVQTGRSQVGSGRRALHYVSNRGSTSGTEIPDPQPASRRLEAELDPGLDSRSGQVVGVSGLSQLKRLNPAVKDGRRSMRWTMDRRPGEKEVELSGDRRLFRTEVKIRVGGVHGGRPLVGRVKASAVRRPRRRTGRLREQTDKTQQGKHERRSPAFHLNTQKKL